MQRRRLLRSVALTGTALALAPWLSACGFRLRGSVRFPYSVSYTHLTLPTNREV